MIAREKTTEVTARMSALSGHIAGGGRDRSESILGLNWSYDNEYLFMQMIHHKTQRREMSARLSPNLLHIHAVPDTSSLLIVTCIPELSHMTLPIAKSVLEHSCGKATIIDT